MSLRISTITGILAITCSSSWAGTVDNTPIVAPEPEKEGWQFEIVPFLWTVNLDGDVGVLGTKSPMDVGFDDIWDNLDFAGSMLMGARYDRFSLLLDAEYVKVSPSFDTGQFRTDLTMEQVLIDMRAGYCVWESDRGWLDLTAGARYMNVDLDITLKNQAGTTLLDPSGSEGWWDAIGGLRGRYYLNDTVFLLAQADIGGGGSDLTWQALAGVGFQLTTNVDLRLAYRYLYVDYEDGGFTYDVDSQGIALGLGIRF